MADTTQLRRFFTHSAVYTVGNLVYRGAGFVLIPLYTHVLPPSEYGTLELYYLTAAIFQTLVASGIAHATLRFYFEYDTPADRNAVVSTALIGSFVVSAVGAVLLWPTTPSLSEFLFKTVDHSLAFRIVFASVVFEISREINLAFIRAREQSAFFVVIAVVQLIVQVAANITTVVVLELGIMGILIGNLISTVCVWGILIVHTFRACGVVFDRGKLTPLLRYGAPLMLSGIVATVIASSDRYILNVYGGTASIGLYALAIRFREIPNLLLVDPMSKSFGPFRFAIMKRDDAHQIYSQVLSHFFFLGCTMIVGIIAFGEYLVEIISADTYSGAAAIVPLIVAPTVLGGVTYIFQTGTYLSKRSRYILYATTATGITHLLLNIVLIPPMGLMGAALASVGSALVAVTVTFFLAHRARPIAWDFRGIPKTSVAAMIAAALVLSFPLDPVALGVTLRTIVLAVFVFFAAPQDVRSLFRMKHRLSATS